jgi:hypothetical protein
MGSMEAMLGESLVFTRPGHRRSGPRTTLIHPARTLLRIVWFANLVLFKESRLLEPLLREDEQRFLP